MPSKDGTQDAHHARAARARTKLRTLAAAAGARPASGRGTGPAKSRTFNITRETVERAQAAVVGISAKTYGTELDGQVPATLGDLIEECITAGLTYYEDLLNHGHEFPPRHHLPRGPAIGRKREGTGRAPEGAPA